MTRTFDGKIDCPNCGHQHTRETALERWIRNHESLDSSSGIVRFDCDILLHRYMVKIDKKSIRKLQCVMIVEAKVGNEKLSPAQEDTLSLLSQVLRNRRTNIHSEKNGRHASNHVPYAKAMSIMSGRNIYLRMYGAHLLRMEKKDPPSSKWMTWDGKPIDMGQLIDLLRFDLDPDTLNRIDWRRRYSSFEEKGLFDGHTESYHTEVNP